MTLLRVVRSTSVGVAGLKPRVPRRWASLASQALRGAAQPAGKEEASYPDHLLEECPIRSAVSMILVCACARHDPKVSDSAGPPTECPGRATTSECPMTVCQHSCLDLGEELECCADEFPGFPISEDRALCVAHAHGLQAGLSVCFAEQRFDVWAAKNILSFGCDERSAAGGETFAVGMEDGELWGVGVWTADSFQECP